MTVLVATDLDRTLIYSASAAGRPVAGLVRVEHDTALSYMTQPAHDGLAALARRAVVVPVTTRTVAQLTRVNLPIPQGYAIAANGGVLLHHGRRDGAWDERIAAVIAAAAGLPDVLSQLRDAVAGLDGVRSVREAEGLFCYAVFEAPVAPHSRHDTPVWGSVCGAKLAEVTEWAAARGWRASAQGRKFYLVPAELTKAAAVAEVARRCDADLMVSAGDSLLDADLLLDADRGVIPSHGELFEQGWSAPHVERVPGSGALAGEQIVQWLTAAAGPQVFEPESATASSYLSVKCDTSGNTSDVAPYVQLHAVYELPPALNELGPYFAVATHDHRSVREEPWLSLAQLLDDEEVLTARVDSVRGALARAAGRVPEQIEHRVAASIAQMGLVSRLISPAIGLAVVGGLGLRWDAARTGWQPVLGGPYPLSLDGDAVVEASDRLVFELLDGPVRRLVELTEALSVSPQVLWGNVASAVHAAATMVARARPSLAAQAWDVRSVFLEYQHLQGTLTPEFQRRSCCLLYRIASNPQSGYCGDCIHLKPVSSVLG